MRERDDLGRLRLALRGSEVQGELTLTRRNQRPEQGPKWCATLERGAGLFDDQEIAKTVVRVGVRANDRVNQSPLLEIAQAIVTDEGIELADVPQAIELLP